MYCYIDTGVAIYQVLYNPLQGPVNRWARARKKPDVGVAAIWGNSGLVRDLVERSYC